MTDLLAALTCALICAVAVGALAPWARRLAGSGSGSESESGSRWLHPAVPAVFAAAGGAGASVLARHWAELAAFFLLAVACALLVAIDLAVFRLPDAIVGPMYPVLFAALTVAAVVSGDWGALGRAALGAAVLLFGYFLLALINPSGLGLGDVKLSGLLGAFLGWLGWPAVVAGTLAAFVINAVVALVLLVARRVSTKSGIAFGPAMVVGAAVGAAYWAARTSAGMP